MDMEWYQSNPRLQEAEIEAMNKLYPDAKWGYSSNGRMYWTIIIHPVIFGEEKEWVLLAVYEFYHPHKGASVRVYPVKPNYNEMMKMIEISSVTPKDRIPNIFRDYSDLCILDTLSFCDEEDKKNKCKVIKTAAYHIRLAIRWITIFEVGLVEQKVWSVFSGTGYGNKYKYICNHFSYIPEINHLQ